MNRDEVHRAWAPAGEPWSAWVKPVLFAHLDEEVAPRPLLPSADWLRSLLPPLAAPPPASGAEPHPYRADVRLRDTAIVIDLPGDAGTRVGLGLVDAGFRPIPLYNAVPSRFAVVAMEPIMALLVDGADRVASLSPGAPPAFLLDARRMSADPPVGAEVFDNRSVLSVSDVPTAETLARAGIRRVLVIQTGERPAADLEAVLFAWQARGVALWRKLSDDAAVAAPFTLARRWWLSRVWWAARRSLLRRRDDDAYGMFLPTGGGG